MQPHVFSYHDPIEFLSAHLQFMQKQNEKFSMRAWSKQLGMNHVAMLSMVLNRKRKLLPPLASKISQHLKKQERFNDFEARYFDILVLFHNSTTTEEKNFYEGILSNLKPDRSFSTLELDKLNVISDWYHSVILEMFLLSNFKMDPQSISKKFERQVSEAEVKNALDRLLRLGLIEKNEDGSYIRTKNFLATPTDVPDKNLRKYHSEMIQKAIVALERQSVQERDITSFTFAIDSQKIPEAKRMIREFRRKLAAYLESGKTDSVYQLNIQLFDLLPSASGDKK